MVIRSQRCRKCGDREAKGTIFVTDGRIIYDHFVKEGFDVQAEYCFEEADQQRIIVALPTYC